MADGVVEYIVRLTDKTKTGTRSAVQGSERLEKQTKDTARAVDKLGDESAQTGRQLDRMGKEGRQAVSGMRGLSRGLSGALSSVSGLTGGVGGLVAALGVGALAGTLTAAARAAFNFGQQIADLRNDVSDAATRSGIAADTLQALRLAAEGAGLQFSALTPGLDQFGRRLMQAAEGGNKTAEAFATLGVRVRDELTGEVRSADAVLRDTLRVLNGMESSGERTALALETLGRSGGRLLQALSGTELEAFVALTSEFGVNVGPRAAESAGRWQRASAELTLVLDGLKAELYDTVGGADALFKATEVLVVGFTYMGGIVSGFFEGFESAIDRIRAPFDALNEGVADFVDGLERLARGDITGALQSLRAALQDGMQAAMSTPEAVVTTLISPFPEAYATALFRGAEAGVEQGLSRAGRLRALRADVLSTQDQTKSEDDGGEGNGDGDEDKTPRRTTTTTASTELVGADTDAALLDLARSDVNRLFGHFVTQELRDAAPDARRIGATQTELSAMLAEGDRNMAEQFAQLEAEAQATRARRLETAQTAIGVTGQVLGGDLGGGLSSVAGARGMPGLGVAGAVVSGLQFIGDEGAKGIEKTLDGVKDGLIAALEALPELIGQILPEFAISLVSELIPALIANAPEIFRSLLIDLPKAIADALASLLGVESRTGKGALRGAGIGAVIGGVVLGLPTFGLGVGAGAAIGGAAGGAIGATVTAGRRNARESGNARNSARTASAGQMSTARESDRLAAMSTRSRARSRSVQGNPFDALAAQFDAQFGTYGRATSTTIGVPA